MSLKALAREIRALTYEEMVTFTEEFQNSLDAQPGNLPGALIDCARRLPQSKDLPGEQEALQRVFARKKNLDIKRVANGWMVSMPSLPGVSATDASLREALNQWISTVCVMDSFGALK